MAWAWIWVVRLGRQIHPSLGYHLGQIYPAVGHWQPELESSHHRLTASHHHLPIPKKTSCHQRHRSGMYSILISDGLGVQTLSNFISPVLFSPFSVPSLMIMVQVLFLWDLFDSVLHIPLSCSFGHTYMGVLITPSFVPVFPTVLQFSISCLGHSGSGTLPVACMGVCDLRLHSRSLARIASRKPRRTLQGRTSHLTPYTLHLYTSTHPSDSGWKMPFPARNYRFPSSRLQY